MIINISFNQNESKQSALYSSHKVLNETTSYLEYKVNSILEVLNLFAFDETVQELVRKDPAEYSDNLGLWGADAKKIMNVFYRSQVNKDISAVHIYMRAGIAQITENEDFINLNQETDAEWYKLFAPGSSMFAWFPSSYFDPQSVDHAVTIVRKIPNDQNIQTFDGIVRADIPQSVFTTVLEQAVFTKSTKAILYNDRNEMLSSFGDGSLIEEAAVMDMLDRESGSNFESALWKEVFLQHEKMLLGIQDIPKTDWKLALVIPYKDILALSIKSRNQLLWIFLIVAPLTLPISFLVSASATKRIRYMINHIRRFKKGAFNARMTPGSRDEIGELIQNFNDLLANMAALIDEQYIMGKEMKNSELKALQAQINPHFLYNTLDLINCKAIEMGSSDIVGIVEELARFYKLSLSSGADVVTILNELQHIEAYVRIQNMRFGNGIALHIDVPPPLFSCTIVKLTLQPLVENAILHGILEKEDESGTIRISGEIIDRDLVLTVKDDGVGMDRTVMQRILSGTPSNLSGGYGVRNIHARLVLAYGSQYGLSYDSSPSGGTTVRITIPGQRRDEANTADF